MKIIPLDVRAAKIAAQVLESGGVLIYPTDTCYGLGADFTNPAAHAKIYEIKGRDVNKAVSVIMRDLAMIEEYCPVGERERKILKRHLPGPFTFILEKHGGGTLGIRIPAHPFTQALSERFAHPYVTTSANISRQPAPYHLEECAKNIIIDLAIDAGTLPANLPSTIVDLTKNPPVVLREGVKNFRKYQSA